MKIVKLSIWFNPTTMRNTEGSRWDSDVVYDNGERKRITRVTLEQARTIIEDMLLNS